MQRHLTILAFVSILTAPAVASANDTFELEAHLAGLAGGHVRIGLQLDPHAVVLVGPWASYSEYSTPDGSDNGSSNLHLSVPLELKIYFVEPAAGVVAPLLRAGIFLGWQQAEYGGESTHVTRAGGSLGGGVAWFANETVGLEIELGAHASRAVDGESTALGGLGSSYHETSIGFGGRAGVVLRL